MADLPDLMLLRHAKAESGGRDHDHERVLSGKGRKQSAAVGRWLAEHGIQPDLVWCSTAARARQTWEGVAAELPSAVEAAYDRAWYVADVDDAVLLLRQAPTEVRSLMVVGHNPTIEELAGELTGQGRAFPTGALAVLRCDQPWPDVQSATWKEFVDPHEL
jgi:phosphohistidine phosphatase